LKRHFHVTHPQLATHYVPEGHPARTVAFGERGCVAHIYPSGRVEAYGQDTSEAAVRETATKACEWRRDGGGARCGERRHAIPGALTASRCSCPHTCMDGCVMQPSWRAW
jgi:hypothetical protein